MFVYVYGSDRPDGVAADFERAVKQLIGLYWEVPSEDLALPEMAWRMHPIDGYLDQLRWHTTLKGKAVWIESFILEERGTEG